MNILALTLHARDLEAQRAFYADTLGLPVLAAAAEHLTLGAGTTRLTFVRDGGFSGFSHVAFDMPSAQVDAAQAWLEARTALLTDRQGQRRFELGGGWNSVSFYFGDPAGNLLELIARRDLPPGAAGPFGPASLRRVSELGVVVPDVPQAVSALGVRRGLRPFLEESETFTPVGGPDGMLIVVRAGRGWFPVGRPATAAPFHLTFTDGGVAQELTGQELTD